MGDGNNTRMRSIDPVAVDSLNRNPSIARDPEIIAIDGDAADVDYDDAGDPINPYGDIQNRGAVVAIKQPPKLPAMATLGEDSMHITEAMLRHLAGNDFVDNAIKRHMRGKQDAERAKSDTRRVAGTNGR